MKKNKIIWGIITLLTAVFIIILFFFIFKFKHTDPVIRKNKEIYVQSVDGSEIIGKSMPQDQSDTRETYVFKITPSLNINDMEGRHVDAASISVGSILIFDYIMNSKEFEPYNIRLSDEVFNYKFWNVELDIE